MILIQLTTQENNALDPVPYVQTAAARFAALGIGVEHSATSAFHEFRGEELVGNVICIELSSANVAVTALTEALARVEAALKVLAKDANRTIKFRLLVSVDKESPASDTTRKSDRISVATGC